MIWMLLACQQENIRVFATEEQLETITFFIQSIGDERLEVVQSSNPSTSARRYNGWSVALELNEESIADAYRISTLRDEKFEWVIQGDTLGMQYGLADVLERMNYRFYHPYKSYVPEDIVEPQIFDIQEEWQIPEMNRRGLHMHTLHPIEGYYDIWETSEDHLYQSLIHI